MYLKARIRFWLDKLEMESDKARQWLIIERHLRELLTRLRQNRGFGSYWPIGFAAVMCFLFIYAGMYETHHGRYCFGNRDGSPGDTVQILKRYDARRYQMRWIHGSERTPFVASFCEDVPFSAGHTLTWLAYQERGSCNEVLNPMAEFGYVFEKDEAGLPTLAPNCHNASTIVECSPVLTEAKF